MAADPGTLMRVVVHIRRSFWLLKAVSDTAIADLGLTSSTRAVLEHLQENGPATVPQIAAAKTVARQSIQALVDQLLRDGHVALAANPAHRRSHLVTITPQGTSVFSEVRRRDEKLLRRLAADLDEASLVEAAGVLQRLRELLTNLNGGSNDHENDRA